MTSRWLPLLAVLLTLLNTAAISIGIYVSLRLEPLYLQVAALQEDHEEHQKSSRAVVDDYIAWKAQTIEILRQQNAEIADIKAETRRIRRSN